MDDPATVDTGVGIPEVIDMGAFEFGSQPLGSGLGDLNGDGAVDLTDYVLFQMLFTGP